MEKTLKPDFIQNIQKVEVMRIAANSKHNQVHVDRILFGQSQGLSFKIYAPIWEIKKRMRT